ncbi:GAF domain-containing sensor histidine kinase [Parafrankia elaeagni]|uniref:GAF domain-containing sensor histidine kinase n=1 Tax=Parafrankia elaeagni TaxID=222534 RepID=UPI00037A1192|nr:GAF domain-containing protein [Parafrankia elaeagni]
MVQTGAGTDALAASAAEAGCPGGARRPPRPATPALPAPPPPLSSWPAAAPPTPPSTPSAAAPEVFAVQHRMRGLLEAVVDVARELSLPVTLRRIAEAARSLVDCDLGVLGVLGPDGHIAELIGGGPGQDVPADIVRMPLGRGLIGGDPIGGEPIGGELIRPSGRAGHAARPGTVVVAADVLGFPAGAPGFGTFLRVPIAVRGEAFGNLYLAGKRGSEFTQEDEDLVHALAAAVGFAIENARLYETTRRRQAWLTASAEITTALLSVAEPVEALRLVARRARQITSALLAGIVLPVAAPGAATGRGGTPAEPGAAPLPGGPFRSRAGRDARGPVATELEVAVVDGAGADDLRGRLLADPAELLDVMRAGRALIIPPERADPAARRLLGEVVDGVAIGAVMIVPLLAAGRPLGILVLAAAPGVVAFEHLDLEMAAAFAGHAALTLEFARVQREGERLAVFEERDRIARDLHDVVIQRLFATGLQIQGMTRVIDPDAAVRLNAAVRELDQTIADIRQTIFSLTAASGSVDLRSEIAAIAAQAEQALAIRPTVHIDGPVDRGVPAVIHPHLLAAVREALSNIARHARATRIQVRVRVTNTDVSMQVRDNGCGPGGASRSSGLANLRRRALDLGGRMEFGPGEGGIGTTVTWQVPLVQPIPTPRVLRPPAGSAPGAGEPPTGP